MLEYISVYIHIPSCSDSYQYASTGRSKSAYWLHIETKFNNCFIISTECVHESQVISSNESCDTVAANFICRDTDTQIDQRCQDYVGIMTTSKP